MNLGPEGDAYNGELLGTPAISTNDYVVGSGAMHLSSQSIKIPAFKTGSTGLSIAFWFKAQGGDIFDFGNGCPSNDIIFGLTGSGDCYISITNADVSIRKDSIFGFRVNYNNYGWRHVAWTIDSNGYWLIYLNGKLYKSYGQVFYPNSVTRLFNRIGSYDGFIDEFYLFQSVLLEDRVNYLYSQSKLHFVSPTILTVLFSGCVLIYGVNLIISELMKRNIICLFLCLQEFLPRNDILSSVTR